MKRGFRHLAATVVASAAFLHHGSSGAKAVIVLPDSGTVAAVGAAFRVTNTSANGRAIEGLASSTGQACYGGWFETASTAAAGASAGVMGRASGATGNTFGGYFQSMSSSGTGVFGFASGATGSTKGVSGTSTSTSGIGVLGIASAQTGTTSGGYFQNASTSGRAVFAKCLASSGTNYAVYAESGSSASAYAGWFQGRVNVTGRITAKEVEITGADLAEKFPFSDAPEPGMVAEIDPDHAGKLRIARGAYNRRVAGVVSGAGDLKAGAILGNMAGSEDAPPIALSGRVWVHCDAGDRAIEPGDLLTTSDTPGHAMKAADRDRSHGAVIGKAMTGLTHGERGLVLVLVNLQ
ncbi:MAG: hypothetical protein AB7Q17_11110 [Phycisphaerae bacterium]